MSAQLKDQLRGCDLVKSPETYRPMRPVHITVEGPPVLPIQGSIPASCEEPERIDTSRTSPYNHLRISTRSALPLSGLGDNDQQRK